VALLLLSLDHDADSDAGLHLYNASAVFVRHTMIALYSNLSVELKRITVNSSSSRSPSAPSPQSGEGSDAESGGRGVDEWTRGTSEKAKPRHRREKSVFIALTVTGKVRVSGSLGIWDV
jgi:hypothetical protein